MNTMNFLLGVMGTGSAAFVGLSAYAVVEARNPAAKKALHPVEVAQQPSIIPIEKPIEEIAVEEAPIVAPVVPEEVPIPAPVPAPPTLEIGYWPIRGLAAPLRMLLEYTGAVYQEQLVDAETWFGKIKPEALKSNAFMNLPYVKDGDEYISQSNACLQYLGAKLGLDPKDVLDPSAISNAQVLHEIFDLRNAVIGLSYPHKGVSRTEEEYERNRMVHLSEQLPKTFGKLEAHLEQKGTPFFSSTTPMSADFHVWEMLDQHEVLARSVGAESPLTRYPKLQGFYTTIRELPQLQKYFESEAYRMPINSPKAKAWFY